jgi:hypothetical protein
MGQAEARAVSVSGEGVAMLHEQYRLRLHFCPRFEIFSHNTKGVHLTKFSSIEHRVVALTLAWKNGSLVACFARLQRLTPVPFTCSFARYARASISFPCSRVYGPNG